MRSSVALLAAAAAVAVFSVVAQALYRPVAAVPVASSLLSSVNVSEPLTPLVKTACGDGGLLVIYGAGGRPVIVLVYAQEEPATGELQGCAAKAATCLMTLGVPPAEARRTEETLASQLTHNVMMVSVATVATTTASRAVATATATTVSAAHSATTATVESRGIVAGEMGSKTVSGAASAPWPGGGGASTTRHVSGSWGLRAAASLLAGAAAAAAVMLAWRRSL